MAEGSSGMPAIGTPVRRREDYRFLTGQGTYTDDINRPGQLHAYILRSPHANARLSSIDTSAAASAPGVVAVYTGADMAADGIGGLPCGRRIQPRYRRTHSLYDQPEPACDPAVDGRLRAAPPGSAAARRRPRCRRRLRLEDLSLRRGGDRHLGCAQGQAAGQMDRRPLGKL